MTRSGPRRAAAGLARRSPRPKAQSEAQSEAHSEAHSEAQSFPRSFPRPIPRVAAWVAALLAVLLSAVGCARGSSVTQVTVTAGAVTVTVPPALACSAPPGATVMSCAGGEDDTHAPHLALAPGTPVDVSVPTAVGDTPWVIVFSYRNANGAQQGDRTAVFAPKSRYTYRLQPPAGAQLTRLEVQSLTAAPGANGGVEFPAVGSWVLVVDPVTGSG